MYNNVYESRYELSDINVFNEIVFSTAYEELGVYMIWWYEKCMGLDWLCYISTCSRNSYEL